MELPKVKADFAAIVESITLKPLTMLQFILWLDMKLSEFKVNGYMVLDQSFGGLPEWLESLKVDEYDAGVESLSESIIITEEDADALDDMNIIPMSSDALPQIQQISSRGHPVDRNQVVMDKRSHSERNVAILDDRNMQRKRSFDKNSVMPSRTVTTDSADKRRRVSIPMQDIVAPDVAASRHIRDQHQKSPSVTNRTPVRTTPSNVRQFVDLSTVISDDISLIEPSAASNQSTNVVSPGALQGTTSRTIGASNPAKQTLPQSHTSTPSKPQPSTSQTVPPPALSPKTVNAKGRPPSEPVPTQLFVNNLEMRKRTQQQQSGSSISQTVSVPSQGVSTATGQAAASTAFESAAATSSLFGESSDSFTDSVSNVDIKTEPTDPTASQLANVQDFPNISLQAGHACNDAATCSVSDFCGQLDSQVDPTQEKNTRWAVKVFKEWLITSNKTPHFEHLSPAMLNTLLVDFYGNIRQRSGQLYSKSGMISLRAGLNRFLQEPPISRTIHLVKDVEFVPANEVYETIILETMNRDIEHKVPISMEDVTILYTGDFFSDLTPVSLQHKVFFEIILHFRVSNVKILKNLKRSSFKFSKDSNGQEYAELSDDIRALAATETITNLRMYATNAMHCPLRSLKFYLSKLNEDCDDFFAHPDPNRLYGRWYLSYAAGSRSLKVMMKRISIASCLSQQYTNSCIAITDLHTYHSTVQGVAARQRAEAKNWT